MKSENYFIKAADTAKWIVNVIKSCITKQQLRSCLELKNNFTKLYRKKLIESDLRLLIDNIEACWLIQNVILEKHDK